MHPMEERKTILLVDDEPNILISLEFLMKKEGFNTLTATNGQEALASMQQQVPDIILLDVMMPILDGFATAQHIRENPSWDHIPIIFLTAKGTNQDKVSGYSSGAEVYITKPFDNDALLDIVREIAY